MKFLYFVSAYGLIIVGGASLFFNATLPFDAKMEIVTIASGTVTLDTVLFVAGLVLLVLGWGLSKVNN